MKLLHDSSIKFHGNLKSRNCVIDSRWVLKLTDFGLPNIYMNQKCIRESKASDLLWTAPEHLRQNDYGSAAGDVYSFSIIMQEIITEKKTYEMMNLKADEIVRLVRDRQKPLFRPIVSRLLAPSSYIKIMKNCWNEKPNLRPSFNEVYSMFKSLNGQNKENIVDWLIKTIEDYTKNLELLVSIQTRKLNEEKCKFSKLLREIFPK